MIRLHLLIVSIKSFVKCYKINKIYRFILNLNLNFLTARFFKFSKSYAIKLKFNLTLMIYYIPKIFNV